MRRPDTLPRVTDGDRPRPGDDSDDSAADGTMDVAAVPSLPRRWLVAVELFLAAQAALDRAGQVDIMVAVTLADAGSEALLGHIAGIGGDALPEKWDALLNAAFRRIRDEVGGPPQGLGAALTSCHKARNAAVHNGVQPSQGDAENGISAGRQLLGLLPRVDPTVSALPDGAGLLGAVAEVVAAIPPLAQSLRDTERHLREGRILEAADAGAIALQITLDRTVPPVRPWNARGPGRRNRDLDEFLKPIHERIGFLGAWVVPLALGVRPIDFARMHEVFGEVVRTMDGKVHHYRKREPSEQEVRRAAEELALVVARLAQAGALFTGSDLDAVTRTYRESSGW